MWGEVGADSNCGHLSKWQISTRLILYSAEYDNTEDLHILYWSWFQAPYIGSESLTKERYGLLQYRVVWHKSPT